MRGLALAALAGFLAAWLSWTRPGDPVPQAPGAGPGVTIHVLDNGFHTDIAVPRAALQARPGPLGQAARGLGPGDWVLIGWGDARFYVSREPIHDRLGDGARALFRPGNASVVMLDPTSADPARRTRGRVSLTLTQPAAQRLLDRVEASLATEGGTPSVIRRPGDDAVFLPSREAFSALRLCNHWSAEVLNAGGVAVRPVQSIRSAEVMGAVRRARDMPMNTDDVSRSRHR